MSEQTFRVTQNYQSSLGAYAKGDVVTLPEDFAAHINRDAPGTLEPVEDVAKTRVVDAPPADRMVRTSRRRDRQGDPGDQGAMSREDFKAVRDR